MVIWDKKNKHLQAFQYRLMADLVEGRKPLSETNKKYATYNLTKLKEHGFIE